MNEIDGLLLDALRCAIHNEQVSWAKPISREDWLRLFRRAEEHHVLPMLAETVRDCPIASECADEIGYLKETAKKLAIAQARRTGELLLLLRELNDRGVSPIITKGVICRFLYPHPDERTSVDEDMLVGEGEFPLLSAALTELGYETDGDTEAFEVTYKSRESGLTVEVHKQFFAPSSPYEDCNAPFADAASRSVAVEILGTCIRTLSPADHLLYLILHAYKHFLHGGVGIRQIADVCLFARQNGGAVDMEALKASCRGFRTDLFAAAFFMIGEEKLGIPAPEAFRGMGINYDDLLADVLSGGLYGTVSEDRSHSSNMTLDAIRSNRSGRRGGTALRSVFLPASALKGRYPYLKKRPWLLPAAWAQRAWGYLAKRRKGQVRPTESIRIGRERIALLKEYGIID